MHFEEENELKELGFTGFKTIQELTENKALIPTQKGIYCIVRPVREYEFLEVGCGGYFKGKNPNVSVSILALNWVEKSHIIYIGKAGGIDSKSTLRSRLTEYLNFGQGKPVGHRGGRFIWQLKNSKDLIIAWKILDGEEPRNHEIRLIKNFVDKYGKRPFANLKN